MDVDRKAKSFSLESAECEDATVPARRGSSSLSSSLTDIRSLEDGDYRALLDVASQASYKRSLTNNCSSNSAKVVVPDENADADNPDVALSSTGLSKDAWGIYANLKEKADRDAYREDEAIEVGFHQKKLGKSASHESCQPKPTRPSSGRHSVYSMNSSVDVDTGFSTCLFGGNSDGLGKVSSGVARGPSSIFSSRLNASSTPNSGVACGCTSPDTTTDPSQRKETRSLNRSYSSTGGTNWSSNIGDSGDNSSDTAHCNPVDGAAMVDDNAMDWKRTTADGDKGSRDEIRKTSSTATGISLQNDDYPEPVEMEIMSKRFSTSFLSSSSVTGHSNGKKRRSSSQRGHNTRRQGDYELSPQNPLTDDTDRMTRSELGPISGIKSPPRPSRLFRRKRGGPQEEGVILSHQLNGFRGADNLDDILMYIEGPDAVRKGQCDQQSKKAKKKTASESGTVSGNSQSNGGAKKEKIRRSTEGDDCASVFSTLKSTSDADSGTLNYKHRSTDSLGPCCDENDGRTLAACGKSTSSDGSISFGRSSQYTTGVVGLGKATDVVTGSGSVGLADASAVTCTQIEGTKERATECGNKGDTKSGSATSLTPGEEEQFIPVTNKKQKKTRVEQLRSVPVRYSRSTKERGNGNMNSAKRSVTPPARETMASNGRRRRNSLDYSRVNSEDDLKTDPPAANDPTEPLFVKADSGDGAVDPTAPSSDPADGKPSYANVAAHRRVHSPPLLADFITRESMNKQKFHKKRTSTNHAGSRVGRMTRDDGGRNEQTPRQSSSLHASRSTSPAGIPTAVATNLANASSPDLKNFTGEHIPANIGPDEQPSKMTYATIAAEKRLQHTTSKTVQMPHPAVVMERPGMQQTSTDTPDQQQVTTGASGQQQVPTGTSGQQQVPSDTPGHQQVPIDTPGQQQIFTEDRPDDTGEQLSQPVEGIRHPSAELNVDITAAAVPGAEVCDPVNSSTDRKDVTDTAVNTDPLSPPSATAPITDTCSIPTTNLGESAFTFEQTASTSEAREVVRSLEERSSCSGIFQSPDGGRASLSNTAEESGTKMNSTSGGGGNNRERRNSCPVQFLDKAKASFDQKPLNVSGLNFLYGDAEGDEELCAALARSATVSSTTTDSAVETVFPDTAPTTNETSVSEGKTQIITTDVKAPEKIPDKTLRTMANYVSKAWADFTRDSSSTVYYGRCG